MQRPRIQFLLCLLVYMFILRLLPYVLMNCDIKMDPAVLYYPWNFSPLTAVCLFGGAFLADRRLSLLVPLATLFLSDLGILAVTGKIEWAFPAGHWALTYISFTAAAALGFLLRHRKPKAFSRSAIVAGTVIRSRVFRSVEFSGLGAHFGRTDVCRHSRRTSRMLSCSAAILRKIAAGNGDVYRAIVQPAGCPRFFRGRT